jgi:hypothetical protein
VGAELLLACLLKVVLQVGFLVEWWMVPYLMVFLHQLVSCSLYFLYFLCTWRRSDFNDRCSRHRSRFLNYNFTSTF